MKRGDVLENVQITGIAAKGEGVGRFDGQVVFVKNAVPGDVLDVQVGKVKKKHIEGENINLRSSSPNRREPTCEHFEFCGGCKWQHLSYEAQLENKFVEVTETLRRIGGLEIPEAMPALGAPSEFHYRNKLEYTFSNKRWLTPTEISSEEIVDNRDGLGFHIAGAFDKVLDISRCHLQREPTNFIREWFRSKAKQYELEYFDLRAQTGILRNLIVRTNEAGECMVVFIVAAKFKQLESMLQELYEEMDSVTSVYYVINAKRNDSIADLDPTHLCGEVHLQESLGHVKFLIGPKSFFQTNSRQAEALYKVVEDFADLQGEEVVYDLYSGIGSIGLYLARNASAVVGIEYVEAAVHDAYENAKLNNIEHAKFYAGDMAKIFTDDFIGIHGTPDVVITDPPRAGMHPKVVSRLRDLAAKKIVYVSCNPATQARDLEILASEYRIEKFRPVDMFPQTSHVENVACLIKK